MRSHLSAKVVGIWRDSDLGLRGITARPRRIQNRWMKLVAPGSREPCAHMTIDYRVEVRGFEPLTPTLRTLRPHPRDQAIYALTWGFVLIASHRFAWFRTVSRT